MYESLAKRLFFHHGGEDIVLGNNFSKDQFHSLRYWSLTVNSVKMTFREAEIENHIPVTKACTWFGRSSFKVTV